METLELIANQAQKSRDAFSSREDYEEFRKNYADSVRAKMKKNRIARQKSEEAARRHHIVS